MYRSAGALSKERRIDDHMHLPIGEPRIGDNRRARYMFPGQVYHVQETRKLHERKYRDWHGWLELVAEYHKEALLANDALHTNRPEPLAPSAF
jgi:hypothetical protein